LQKRGSIKAEKEPLSGWKRHKDHFGGAPLNRGGNSSAWKRKQFAAKKESGEQSKNWGTAFRSQQGGCEERGCENARAHGKGFEGSVVYATVNPRESGDTGENRGWEKG